MKSSQVIEQLTIIDDEITKFEESLSSVNELVIQVETLTTQEREELSQVAQEVSEKLQRVKESAPNAWVLPRGLWEFFGAKGIKDIETEVEKVATALQAIPRLVADMENTASKYEDMKRHMRLLRATFQSVLDYNRGMENKVMSLQKEIKENTGQMRQQQEKIEQNSQEIKELKAIINEQSIVVKEQSQQMAEQSQRIAEQSQQIAQLIALMQGQQLPQEKEKGSWGGMFKK